MMRGEIELAVTALRNRERTAVELIDECLSAAEAGNGAVNAFVTRTEDQARQTAKRIDRDGPDDRPLLGIPFTVKDSIQTAGVRTTAGSLLLADNMPAVDAPAVRRLKRAGAVMVGKTNCSEFALDIHTANRLVGVTRNPLDTGRTSGGSSGGDSAAVAAGFSMFGLGTDYGASLRWPAHCTGVVTIRPTAGRISSDGLLPNDSAHLVKPVNSLSVRGLAHTVGPIARSVSDVWTLLAVLADLDSQPRRVETSRLRVAWFTDVGNVSARADVVQAIADAAGRLASAGATVEQRHPPGINEAAATLQEMRAVDGLVDVERLAAGREDLLADTTRTWLSSMRHTSVTEFQDLASKRDSLRADAEEFLDEWPIWLLPVATIPAFEIDAADPGWAQPRFEVDGMDQERYEIVAACWAVSLYGFPSVVIPVARSRDGLPIGVQIVGRPNRDFEVLAVALVLEALIGEGPGPGDPAPRAGAWADPDPTTGNR